MRTRVNAQNKEQVFCEWRKKWVRLTPEEWVRQQLLRYLTEQLGYPVSRIAVEAFITVGEVKKRCDAIVYNEQLQPIVLIECKAETVPITQKTLDQAVIYNRKLDVPYLILYNGLQTVCVHISNQSTSTTIPTYNHLSV